MSTLQMTMPPRLRARIALVAVLATVFALAGCATHISRDLGDDGKAGQVIFPDPASAVLAEGTFPSPDAFPAVAPGMTRDQLYALFGRPHFRAGFSAREWDYLFHFRGADGSVTTCQYKAIFDKARRAQSFHWSPDSCAALAAAPGGVPARIVQADGRAVLAADALFRFAKSGLDDIQPGGRELLDQLAAEVKQAGAVSVQVIGHTDRIGGDADNLALSGRRAETVRAYLVERGVPADTVVAVGRGEREPVQACPTQSGQALIDCLAPNRRVEVNLRPR